MSEAARPDATVPSTSPGSEQGTFGIQFHNLIRILIRLFGDPTAVIRELVSNASTAIFNAKQAGMEDRNDEIRIWLEQDERSNTTVLVVHDTGIGMTNEHLYRFLAEVGDGMNRILAHQYTDDPEVIGRIVGEHGFGFLSSFIIADQVIVLTRHHDDVGRRWISHDLPDVALTDLDWKPERTFGFDVEPYSIPHEGTTVRLRLRKSYVAQWNEPFVRRWVLEHTRQIQEPIYWGPSGTDQINALKAPWYEEAAGAVTGETLRTYLPQLGTQFADATNAEVFVPLRSAEICGVLYFPPPNPLDLGVDGHRIDAYCRRVFVNHEQADLLVPGEFRYVKGVVDCIRFQLDGSRSRIPPGDAAAAAVRQFVGRAILDRLAALAVQATSPAEGTPDAPALARAQLESLLRNYHGFLKAALVLENQAGEFKWGDQYLRALDAVMPFYSGSGVRTSIPEYLERCPPGRQPRILFATSPDEVNQLQPIARQKGEEILFLKFDAETNTSIEQGYLRRYARLIGVECLSGAEALVGAKDDSAAADTRGWQRIVRFFQDEVTHPEFGLTVRLSDLDPRTVVGRLIPAPQGPGKQQLEELIRDIEATAHDGVRSMPMVRELKAITSRRQFYLLLNRQHPVLIQLAQLLDARVELPIGEILHPMFHDIVMDAGHLLAETHLALHRVEVYERALAGLTGERDKMALKNQLEEQTTLWNRQVEELKQEAGGYKSQAEELTGEVSRLRSQQPEAQLVRELFFIRPMHGGFVDHIANKLGGRRSHDGGGRQGGICQEAGIDLDFIDPSEMKDHGPVVPQIIARLRRAAVVVSDISEVTNANVYYESGFVDGTFPGKLILIADKEIVDARKLPFDFITTRIETYGQPAQEFDEFLTRLRNRIRDVLFDQAGP